MQYSQNVLTIGCECKVPHGGIAYVLYTYWKHVFSPFKFVANSGEGGKVAKLWQMLRAYIQCEIKERTDKEIEFVHIHTASYISFKRSTLFIQQAKRNGKTVIVHIHGGGFKDYQEKNPKFVKKHLDICDAIVALSPSWQRFFTEKLGYSNVFVINNIIDYPSIVDVDKDGKFHMLFLGLITEEKGIFDLLEVIHKHREEWDGRIMLHVGGNGKTEQFCQKVAEYGLSNMVTFEGWVNDTRKAQIFCQADAFILPSYIEGVPISILEAMSYGIPILSTPVGGIPEIVSHENNGLLFTPGDQDAIAESINRMIANRDEAKEMGYKGRVLSEEHLPPNVSRQLESMYNIIRKS